jgi:hypothetical protein
MQKLGTGTTALPILQKVKLINRIRLTEVSSEIISLDFSSFFCAANNVPLLEAFSSLTVSNADFNCGRKQTLCP